MTDNMEQDKNNMSAIEGGDIMYTLRCH